MISSNSFFTNLDYDLIPDIDPKNRYSKPGPFLNEESDDIDYVDEFLGDFDVSR